MILEISTRHDQNTLTISESYHQYLAEDALVSRPLMSTIVSEQSVCYRASVATTQVHSTHCLGVDQTFPTDCPTSYCLL